MVRRVRKAITDISGGPSNWATCELLCDMDRACNMPAAYPDIQLLSEAAQIRTAVQTMTQWRNYAEALD
eukprot:5675058-Karenia_brevis.AAC.1